MDIDPEEDNGVDDGVLGDADDDDYGGASQPEHTAPSGRKRRRKNADTTAEDEAADNATPSNLHCDDPGNFLKLCHALWILTSRSKITEADLKDADHLLREYPLELVKVIGE
jgi:hypothetical protein